MDIQEKVISHILSLDSKRFQQYLGVLLGIVFAGCVGTVYLFYTSRAAKIEQLTQLYDQVRKNDKIVVESDKIKAEEERIQDILSDNKGFNIKTFFETFYRQHNVQPEGDWDTEVRSIEGNDTFDEVLLPVTFKKQTTQNMVLLLSALDKHEIVYIKELEIERGEGKVITVNLTIATKKRKQFWEE
ncbi:MAG: hypothetical protein PVJ92_02985 [Candidatus Dependentiae bacterium]|jgi:hypothetical protein